MNNYTTPLVTIGIPCYNVSKYIRHAINSILMQTYTNFELIITDDGSTDNTIEYIRTFEDPRIKLIVDGENRGISYRLNQQIEMAKGDFFVRMDGDDIMFPTRIQTQINYLLEHPDIDVVGSGIVVINKDNSISGIRYGGNNFISTKDYFNNSRFCHPTVMGKISYFRKFKYRSKYNGCEDCDLWIRSFSESKFYSLHQPLLFYRELNTFNINTYLKRRSIGRKMQWENRNYANSFFVIVYCLLISYFRSMAMIFLHYTGLKRILTRKRNSTIEISNEYSLILSSIIYTKCASV